MSDRYPERPPSRAFAFTPRTEGEGAAIIARYPAGPQASAVMPLLDLAQRQRRLAAARGHGLRRRSTSASRRSASTRSRPSTRCSTPSRSASTSPGLHAPRRAGCAARTTASPRLQEAARRRPGEDHGRRPVHAVEVECLGACVNAPMVQINDDYYEDLDAGEHGRRCSTRCAPASGRRRLADRPGGSSAPEGGR
jgi:hypothetical protein